MLDNKEKGFWDFYEFFCLFFIPLAFCWAVFDICQACCCVVAYQKHLTTQKISITIISLHFVLCVDGPYVDESEKRSREGKEEMRKKSLLLF